MKKYASHGSSADELRRQAEQRVDKTDSIEAGMSGEELGRLVYELRIHQEELEIQNEELRRTHVELQTSYDRAADLYDFAPVGYLTVDANDSIVEANLTASRMLGKERSMIVGTRLALHCDPGSRSRLRTHIDNVFANNNNESCELKFNGSNGKPLDFRLDSKRVARGNGEKWQCRMIMTDITRRKRAEQSLIEKDHYLRSLSDALPVLIAYLDAELRFQFNNAAYVDWFGKLPDELKGQSAGIVFGQDCANEISDYLPDIVHGRRVDFESELVHKNKGRRQIQMMLVPDTDTSGLVKGIHSLCLDVTDRRVVEEQNARRRNFTERLVRLNSDERDVYELLIRGESNKAVAQHLDIGLRTAERRRQIIFSKLEVDSIAELLQQLADIQGVEPT